MHGTDGAYAATRLETQSIISEYNDERFEEDVDYLLGWKDFGKGPKLKAGELKISVITWTRHRVQVAPSTMSGVHPW
eukprot:1107535-Rhodomonas_salina.1